MSQELPQLELRLPSVAALQKELPGLEKRRAFVLGAESLPLRAPCQLVLVHPETGEWLPLPAEVVWVQPDGPGKGVGVALGEFDVGALRAFVRGASDDASSPAATVNDSNDANDSDADDAQTDDTDTKADDDTDDTDVSAAGQARAKSLYERIRGLSLRERDACARSGTMTERVALERCYGNSVWESLLQNPQLTPPEVARIAKNGTIPQPLVATIVGNGGWLSVGEVQRALLSNPRVSGPQLDRVLRSLSQSDLKRIAQQTAYRSAVRQAAQRLLKG